MLSPQYVAGFFDGEGNVGISTRGRNKYLYLRVSVSNTNQEILAIFKMQFGGVLATPYKKRSTWKPTCEWIVSGKKAAEFLEAIKAHAILKKAQIELGLEFWKLQSTPFAERCTVTVEKGMTPKVQLIPEVAAKRMEFKRQLSILNKRGSEEAA